MSVSGVTIAPPTPWSARATISMLMSVERAANAEAAVKIVMPIVNMQLAPVAIAERRACQEQDREGECVRVDEPLELAQRRAQILLDSRNGGDDDEVVERRHEQRGRRDPERQASLF